MKKLLSVLYIIFCFTAHSSSTNGISCQGPNQESDIENLIPSSRSCNFSNEHNSQSNKGSYLAKKRFYINKNPWHCILYSSIIAALITTAIVTPIAYKYGQNKPVNIPSPTPIPTETPFYPTLHPTEERRLLSFGTESSMSPIVCHQTILEFYDSIVPQCYDVVRAIEPSYQLMG